MRLPLDDITNTVTVLSSSSDTSNNPSKQLPTSSSPPVPSISLPSLPLKASSRPKLLRQTSLLAFAARSPAPASAPSCSSPTASTSSSSPPPPSSSPSTSIPTHPRSDEGYSSTRDCFVDLACAPSSSSARTTRDEEEDDAQSDTEEQEHYHHNKRLRTQYTQQHDNEASSLARDPAALARQAKAMARNRANLFGETSRVSGFNDIARLAEYGRPQASSSTLSRLTGALRPIACIASFPTD